MDRWCWDGVAIVDPIQSPASALQADVAQALGLTVSPPAAVWRPFFSPMRTTETGGFSGISSVMTPAATSAATGTTEGTDGC